MLETLVMSLVLTRLDYGNATLDGMPANLLHHLQAVLNASARTITGLPRLVLITMSLARLHWLHAAERIQIQASDVDLTLSSLHSPPTTCPLN